jgi:hypothetical protein
MVKTSELLNQIYESQAKGKRIYALEVGTQTWSDMVNICEEQTGKKCPKEKKSEYKEGKFMGIPIRPNNYLPEGRVFLLEE